MALSCAPEGMAVPCGRTNRPGTSVRHSNSLGSGAARVAQLLQTLCVVQAETGGERVGTLLDIHQDDGAMRPFGDARGKVQRGE